MSKEKEAINKPLELLLIKWKNKTESKMKQILSSKGKGQSDIYKKLKLVLKKTSNGFILETGLPDYAIFVDKGRKPGKQPPLKDIREWCRKKGINENAAFPIAREIGRRGIPPTNFLKPLNSFRDLIKEMTKVAADTIGKTIAKTAKETLKT